MSFQIIARFSDFWHYSKDVSGVNCGNHPKAQDVIF